MEDGFFLVSWLEKPAVRFASRYGRIRPSSCFPAFLIQLTVLFGFLVSNLNLEARKTEMNQEMRKTGKPVGPGAGS
jgi:hypothetical protein